MNVPYFVDRLQVIGNNKDMRYINSKTSPRKGEALCMGYHTAKYIQYGGICDNTQIISEWIFLQLLRKIM